MTQVNECKSEMMSTEKVGVLAVKANEQRSELIHPGKTALTAETLLVDGGIEETFPSAFGGFPVAFILTNVGNDTVIEADFPCLQRIKSAVSIEISPSNRQSQAFHTAKGGLEVFFEVESIMMVARDEPSRSRDIALRISDRQDIRGLGSFSRLIRDTLAAFLRQSMAAIEIQVRQIEVLADRLNTLLPDPLKTAIGTPFLEMIVDRLPANLFFSPSFREGAIGNCVH